MAALDEGITNLQRFIAHLVASTGALDKSAEFFKESSDQFTGLANDVEDEGGGLDDELQELRSVLDSGMRQAEDELGQLLEGAREGGETASTAEQRLEQTAADVQAETEKTVDEMAEAGARLVTQGFAALGHTLDQMHQELDAEIQECEQAFDGLNGAAEASQTEAEAAWDTAEAELDEAVSELDQAESALEAAAAENVQGFEAAAGEFEQRCTDLASEVDLTYDALDAALAEEGQGWDQHTAALVTEAMGFVASGAQERLEQPAALVEKEALPALEQEYSALGDILQGAQQTAAELEPLTDDLARCQQVVATIDELMNSLAG
jgi:uncharacterized phage infection (PIP) family protein YhgE